LQLKRILLASKPWERGLPLAAGHARQLAQVADAQFQLLGTVFDARAATGSDGGEPAAGLARDRAVAAARVSLERRARSLRDMGANVTTKVNWGVPVYERILAAARDWRADLVIVGTHEPGTVHTRLTDTDWQLMQRAECPLLLVRNAAFIGYRTVVAAVEPLHGNDEPYGGDRVVLEAGRCIAHACGSTLRAVYSHPEEPVHFRAVGELMDEFGIAASNVDLGAGSAADAIIDAVEEREAGLLVVGMPRRRGALTAMLDRTVERVVAGVTCDVLLVPATVDVARSKVG
jgi:nucleotide-binding universal stress UspA family protein